MEHAYSSARSAPKRLRRLLLALVVLFFTTLASLSAFIAYSALRVPPRSSPNWLIHPTVVYSPFTIRRGDAFQAALDELRIPAYAAAIPSEVSTFTWRFDHPASAPTTVGLVLVRLRTNASASAVRTWYLENLPKPYSHLVEPQILIGPAKERWFQELDVSVSSDTSLYQAATPDGMHGVVVQSLPNSGSTGVTLFRYSEVH